MLPQKNNDYVTGPANSEEWRALLYDTIEANVEVFERDALLGDDLCQLPPDTLDALSFSPLLKIKIPAELGGAEADNALQFDIFSKVAFHNAAAAWCYFIYADAAGIAACFLSEEGLAELGFDDLENKPVPRIFTGPPRKQPTIRPTDGGYLLSGEWSYCSGSPGADWLMALVPNESGEMCAWLAPRSEVQYEAGSWNSLGLRGSGSGIVSAQDVFVPPHLTFSVMEKPKRGGPVFQLSLDAFLIPTISAVAVGVARRVLKDIVAAAKTKTRGHLKKTPQWTREALQHYVAESELKLAAAQLLMGETGNRMIETVRQSGQCTPEDAAEAKAAGSYTADIALDIVSRAARFAGGDAIRRGTRIEQAIRDVHTAASHFLVDQSQLENYGKVLLGQKIEVL